MTTGHCPHGEFDLADGCPQCIEERQVREIVKVRYIKSDTGEPTGREYSYFTAEPLGLDFHVKAPTEHGYAEAVVTALDVPEAEIVAFRDRVRTIPAGSIMVRPAPELDFGIAAAEEVGDIVITKDKAERIAANMPDLSHLEPLTPKLVEVEAEEARQEEVERPSALVTIETQVGKPVPELFPLYQEAASLLQYAKDRVIATAEDLKPATNDLAIIATCKKAMTARKDEIVKPLKAKLDLVNQAFGDLMLPVFAADRLTREKVSKFDQEQRQKAADAKRIEDEKFRLAQEEAALNGTGEFTVPLGTVEQVAPPPERTRTDLGTLGGRDNWKARVVDMKALPDEYKLPDMQTLNAKARSSKGTAVIPGVEFYNDRTTMIRTK